MTDAVSPLLDEVRLLRSLPPPEQARGIREAAGVSQVRLADELGVDRSTLIRWERGSHEPTGPRRVRYARILEDLQRVLS